LLHTAVTQMDLLTTFDSLVLIWDWNISPYC